MATVSYKKLWKLLIEKDMTKTDLQRALKCSSNTIGKMGKNEYVSMKNLVEMCDLFNCQITDIVDVIHTKIENGIIN
jgi:putative transcriptional regulator